MLFGQPVLALNKREEMGDQGRAAGTGERGESSHCDRFIKNVEREAKRDSRHFLDVLLRVI